MVGFSPETGKVTGSIALPFQPGYWSYANTSRIVKGTTALLLQQGWDQAGKQRSLAAVDLSNPAKPRLAYRLPLPADDFYSSVGMLESGNELITSYACSVAKEENVVRHFAVRLDIENPLRPKLVGSYNVPGYVVDFDAARNEVITLDHQTTETKGQEQPSCYQGAYGRWLDQTTGICYGYRSDLHRVSLAESAAHIEASLHDDAFGWSTPRRAEGRPFFAPSYYYGYYYGPAERFGDGGWYWSSLDVTIFSSETLQASKIKAPGVWNSLPIGQSLLLVPSAGQPLTVIDASDIQKPTISMSKETALGYTRQVSVAGDTVYLAQGSGGVQTITLP